MNKLSKEQVAELASLSANVRTKLADLESAVDRYNSVIQDAKEDAIAAHNELRDAVDEAAEFVGSLHSDMEGYFDDRSEKWQEGEKGRAYADWMANFDSITDSVDDLELHDPVDMVDCDLADEIDNLPHEP